MYAQGNAVCSSGWRSDVGWWIPLSQLVNSNIIDRNVTTTCPQPQTQGGFRGDVTAMESFFAQGCVPGSDPSSQLCNTCEGVRGTSSFCREVSGEQLGDAFKCMARGNGQVAFVKHVTPYNQMTSEWFLNGAYDVQDYMLMCKQGGCMELTDFEKCNLSMIPAPAVVCNPANMKLQTREFVQETLDAATYLDAFRSTFFYNESTGIDPNEGGLVFRPAMIDLEITSDDMRAYLGESFSLFQTIDDMTSCILPQNRSSVNNGMNVSPTGTGPMQNVVIQQEETFREDVTIALIIILSVANLVVLLLILRNAKATAEHFERPKEDSISLTGAGDSIFMNSSYGGGFN